MTDMPTPPERRTLGTAQEEFDIATDLAAVLIAYERLEGEMILDDECWDTARVPGLPRRYYERLMELQHKRNVALEKAGLSFKAREKAAKQAIKEAEGG